MQILEHSEEQFANKTVLIPLEMKMAQKKTLEATQQSAIFLEREREGGRGERVAIGMQKRQRKSAKTEDISISIEHTAKKKKYQLKFWIILERAE